MNAELARLVRDDCAEVADGAAATLDALRETCLLITGGTGFIGTWLTELITYLNDSYGFGTRLLLLAQHPDDLRGKAPHLADRPDVQLIPQDVRITNEIPAEVNWIIHAAGTPDSREHALDPVRTIQVIVNGVDAVLLAAKRLPNLRKVLHVSSGLVYGPQPRDLNAIPETFAGAADWSSANSAYAEAKRLAETLCASYRTQHRLPIVTARPFAFIGPYQMLDKPWAINNFVRDSLMGGPIRILGDGSSVRSYMYPSDMAFWLLRILVDGTPGWAFNVGSSHGIALNHLAELIASHSPTPPAIRVGVSAGQIDRASGFVPDTTRASKMLGLSLRVDLITAIRRTLHWNRQLRTVCNHDGPGPRGPELTRRELD